MVKMDKKLKENYPKIKFMIKTHSSGALYSITPLKSCTSCPNLAACIYHEECIKKRRNSKIYNVRYTMDD